MKLVKLSQKSSLIALASVVYIATANATSWTRHIYNNTGLWWGFKINSHNGNFYANCVSNCVNGTNTYKNTDFFVEAGEKWEIKMTTTDGKHNTDVGIADPAGGGYVTYCFHGDNSFVTAHHSGNTGGISLNSPADADVKLNSTDSYPKGGQACSNGDV